MTNTNTLDTHATVKQIMQLADAGCDLVRVTAQGIKEAQNLLAIKEALLKNHYAIPLIADIHYNPKAAEIAAGIIEKVRINPGNYIKTPKNKINYSESSYNNELKEIKQNILPLINICKSHGTAIRIGVNHGSLGQRIIDRYGDTVEGMVNSALEYARICSELDFHKLVLSVKSSNPVMMAEAYRQLAIALTNEKLNYPLHIGVTEAGNGIEGRMKSLVGIGTVLAYGIGDTIRVSLTEDPINEVPVAFELISRFTSKSRNMQGLDSNFRERQSRSDLALDAYVPIDDVKNDKFFLNHKSIIIKSAKSILISIDRSIENKSENSIEDTRDNKRDKSIGNKSDSSFVLMIKEADKYWLCESEGELKSLDKSHLIEIMDNQKASFFFQNESSDPNFSKDNPIMLKLSANDTFNFIMKFRNQGFLNPIIVMSLKSASTIDELIIENCIHPGALILNGMAQGLCLNSIGGNLYEIAQAGFNILQATRAKITQTEYISCRSCGRTQFDIEKRLNEVKAATAHLVGLKIAVMGCIVNGPGEMADADYGYVGAGSGKVTLYKAKEIVKHSIPEEEALNELLKIIKQQKANF